jgi:hypothetical protein
MSRKIKRPSLPISLPLINFMEVFDPEEPYIEQVEIAYCVITLSDTRLIEFKGVRFRNVQFDQLTENILKWGLLVVLEII